MQIIFVLALVLVVIYRFQCSLKEERQREPIEWGHTQFKGEQQIQADYGQVLKTTAGVLAVLADGVGKEKRGLVSSHLAVDSVVSLFKDYQVLSNPVYFFRRAYSYANTEILRTLEDREGGASLACTVIIDQKLYYVLAGDIRIALYRDGSLIPLSEGHTINKLAENAYKQGKLTRQKVLYAMKEERLYNYVGQDGFKEIELYDTPVHLKDEDRVIMMTKGIFNALPWQSIEDALGIESMTAPEQAEEVIARFMNLSNVERDNGSIVVISVNSE